VNQKLLDVLSVGGYLLMLVGILGVYVSHGLFSLTPVVLTLQVVAVLLMIWARMTFKGRSFHLSASPTEGGLVTSGPYHFIRHPIYAAALLFVWAGVGGNFSTSCVLFGLVLSLGAAARIICEEHLVRIRYPEYDQYAAKTKRLIPFVY